MSLIAKTNLTNLNVTPSRTRIEQSFNKVQSLNSNDSKQDAIAPHELHIAN